MTIAKNTKNNQPQGIIKIVDDTKLWQIGTLTLLGYLLFISGPISFIVLLVQGNHQSAMSALAITGTLGIPIFILSLFGKQVFKSNKYGIIIDAKKRIIEFPGGALTANEFSDWFHKEFLLRAMYRKQIYIDEIRTIEPKNIIRENKRVDEKGKEHISYSYRYDLDIAGKFGILNFRFENEVKRSELLAVLRQMTNAGTPVFNTQKD